MRLLSDEETVVQLLRLMKENGRKATGAELSCLVDALDSMERQYSSVLTELQEIRKRLEQTQIPEQASMKDQVLDTLQGVREKLEQAHSQLAAIKDKIISWAKNTLEDVKRLGITALDTAISTLGVQTMLESMEDKTSDSMRGIQASIGKVEIIREELRSAGAHLKNAGYAAIGKQPQQVDGSPVGRFESAVLSPMYAVDSVLADLNCIIWSADEAVDDLHEAAEQCRGKHEKSSVRQQLEQKKAKTTAISTPKPGKKSKEAER